MNGMTRSICVHLRWVFFQTAVFWDEFFVSTPLWWETESSDSPCFSSSAPIPPCVSYLQSLCLSPHCAICVGLGMHRLIDSVITSDTVKKKAHHLSHDMHLSWIAIEHQRRPDTDYTDSQESVIARPPLPTSARVLCLMLSHEAARINQYGRQGEWHSLVFWEPAAGDFETVGSMLMKLWVPSNRRCWINQFHLCLHITLECVWNGQLCFFFFQTLLK